jgi:hypothetical protein
MYSSRLSVDTFTAGSIARQSGDFFARSSYSHTFWNSYERDAPLAKPSYSSGNLDKQKNINKKSRSD